MPAVIRIRVRTERNERSMVAMIALGVAERAVDLSIEYAQTRRQFGKPIGSFQMV